MLLWTFAGQARNVCHMLFEIAVVVVFVGGCILGGLYGAESRPDFVDPRVKHEPFVGPFRRS